MKYNVMISRKIKGRVRVKYFVYEATEHWTTDELHEAIKAYVIQWYEGWMLGGYAPVT